MKVLYFIGFFSFCLILFFSYDTKALTSVGIVNNLNGKPNQGLEEMIFKGLANNVKEADLAGNLRNSPYYNPEVFCNRVGVDYYLPMMKDFIISLEGEHINNYKNRLINPEFINERRVGGLNSEWGKYLDLYVDSKFNTDEFNKSEFYLVTATLMQSDSNLVKRFLNNVSIKSTDWGKDTIVNESVKKPIICMKNI